MLISAVDKEFTPFPTKTLQDESLSYGALGILIELLTKPDDWKATRRNLVRKHTGIEKINKWVDELCSGGYLYIPEIGPGNNINNQNWFVSDVSLPQEELKRLAEESYKL